MFLVGGFDEFFIRYMMGGGIAWQPKKGADLIGSVTFHSDAALLKIACAQFSFR